MHTAEQVYDHWMNSLPNSISNADRDKHVSIARQTVFQYNNWSLENINLYEILSAKGTIMEQHYFYKMKVEKYSQFPLETMPYLILIPVDIKQKRVFLEENYTNDIKWEPADGFHRISILQKKNQKYARSFIPVMET